jgi:hypothetical protein
MDASFFHDKSPRHGMDEPICNSPSCSRIIMALEKRLESIELKLLTSATYCQKLNARAIVEDTEMKLLEMFSGMSLTALRVYQIRGGFEQARVVLRDTSIDSNVSDVISRAILDSSAVADTIVPLSARIAVRSAAVRSAHPPDFEGLSVDEIDALVSDAEFPEAVHGKEATRNLKAVVQLRRHAAMLMIAKRSAEAAGTDIRDAILRQHDIVVRRLRNAGIDVPTATSEAATKAPSHHELDVAAAADAIVLPRGDHHVSVAVQVVAAAATAATDAEPIGALDMDPAARYASTSISASKCSSTVYPLLQVLLLLLLLRLSMLLLLRLLLNLLYRLLLHLNRP